MNHKGDNTGSNSLFFLIFLNFCYSWSHLWLAIILRIVHLNSSLFSTMIIVLGYAADSFQSSTDYSMAILGKVSPFPFLKQPFGSEKVVQTKFMALELSTSRWLITILYMQDWIALSSAGLGISNWHLLRLTFHYLLGHRYLNKLHALA